MSFILDALKKSENERQGQRGLGVADVPMAGHAPRAPTWIWWLLGLLGVNVIVLLAVLLRPAPEPVPAAGPAGAPAEPAGIAAQNRSASVPERVAPELAALVDRTRTERARVSPPEPAPSDSAQPSARLSSDVLPPASSAADEGVGVAEVPTATARLTTEPVPTAGPQRTEAPPETPDESGAAARVPAGGSAEPLTLPTLDELRVRGESGLPDLHLDIHVWSEQPRGRFVYVNTIKYREGDALAEGPRVATIVPEGVVLEQGGRRFLLPRE